MPRKKPEPVEEEPRLRVNRELMVVELDIDGGKTLTVAPLTFDRARLHIGNTGSPFFDDGW